MRTKRWWFKAKKYGWGWYPATWEGYVVLFVYLGYVLLRTNQISKNLETSTTFPTPVFIEMILPTIILLVICFIKGEPPHWSWGDKKKKQ